METQGYETGRGRQMPLMGRSQPFLSDGHGQQMSAGTNISQCLAIQKGKDFVFHKHFIYSILIHTLLTVWGSAARSGLLLDSKWAFSILSQNCKCVAGLHPVLLLLPQFHISYTWKYSHNLHYLEKSILTMSTAAIGIAAFMKTVKKNT